MKNVQYSQENAILRAKFIADIENLTAHQIRHLLRPFSAGGRSDLPSVWKREGRIFSIPSGEEELFPAFQFQNGYPVPEIKTVLLALPKELTPWQIAFWFVSGNGWLQGRTPAQSLSNLDSVTQAAKRI